MPQDISGFGISVTLVASVTFPSGIVLTEFADDADPFDNPSIQLADAAMTLNGDLLNWSTANPIVSTINLIPQSGDDINLAILAEANRVGKGKTSARDVITLTGVFPNGSAIIYSNGHISDALPSNSVASAGRLKSKPYIFKFENKADA